MTLSPAEPSDDELLARSVSGDQFAFAMLVERHETMIRRVVGGLLAWSADVPDVVQDVWTTAWRRRTSFAGRSTVTTWLTGIAIQTCRNRRRSRWFRWRSLNTTDIPDVTTDALEIEEDHQRVRTAMSRLSAPVREVIVLYYLEGMTSAEIADRLGVAVNTVDKRLQRAREQLRTLLKRGREDQ